jgi:hypothetical protein
MVKPCADYRPNRAGAALARTKASATSGEGIGNLACTHRGLHRMPLERNSPPAEKNPCMGGMPVFGQAHASSFTSPPYGPPDQPPRPLAAMKCRARVAPFTLTPRASCLAAAPPLTDRHNLGRLPRQPCGCGLCNPIGCLPQRIIGQMGIARSGSHIGMA